MRVLSLFLFIAVEAYTCTAQDNTYSPFVEEGKTWYMKYHNEEAIEYPDYDYYYYFQGDTIVGDLECKKLYVYNENNDNVTKYLMAVYEKDKKVYFIPENMVNSFVLYDFGILYGETVSVSDAIHPDWAIKLQNIGERTIYWQGEPKRCIGLKQPGEDMPDNSSGWWIEGVGSELGPLNTWLFGAGTNRFFQKCVTNEKEIFNKTEFNRIITSVRSDNLNEKNKPADLFSISGVKAKYGIGLYIQDGRKILKK